MSVIQNLREKYAKLTGGIVVIALLGFILMDLGRSGGRSSTTIGKIDGEKIDVQEYEAMLNQAQNFVKQQNGGQPIPSDQDAQLRDQVWNQMVAERVLAKFNDKLGITVTEAELQNLLTGTNPDPMVVQQFTNPKTGEFNPQEVAAQIQMIKKDPKQKENWEAFLKDIKERHTQQKAVSLLTGGVYVPKFVMQDQITGMTDIVNAEFVKVPFTSVADNDAKVSDDEINKYIQSHAKLFNVPKTTRSIQYVSFNVVPSSIDSSLVLNALDTLKNSFETAEDNAAFVNHHSEDPIAPMYYPEARVALLSNSEAIKGAPLNSVIGPIYNAGSFELVKVLAKKTMPDTVFSRHLLVIIKQGETQVRTEEAAKLRVDSAIAALNSGASFKDIAEKYSDDPNSKEAADKGLEFTLTQKPNLEQIYGEDFSDYIFDGHAGETKLIKVELDNYIAYNYVQIVHQSAPAPAYKLAFVSRTLTASEDTYNAIYQNATKFTTGLITDKKGFDEQAAAEGLPVKNSDGIDENSYYVQGLGSARELVKWTYGKETSMGDVSPIFSVEGNYYVAKLVGIQTKGLLQLNDQNRPMLQAMLMKNKKAEIILNQYKDAASSLSAVAQKAGQEIQTMDSIRFVQSFTPELGNEPKVVGYAFNSSLKPNTVSKGIPGNDGVFFISVTSKAKVALDPMMGSESDMKNRIISSLKQNAPQVILQGLVEHTNVKDTRSKLY